MRFLRKVGRRGVLTTPTEVREALGIHEGDIVEFEVIGVVRRNGTPTRPATSSPSSTSTPLEA